MADRAPRARLVVALVAAAACLALAAVTLPKALSGPSQNATVAVPAEEVFDAGPSVAALLRGALAPNAPDARPRTVAALFHWNEELAANKTIEELWKEEDVRPPPVAAPDPASAETGPAVSAEEIARARAIVVKGVVLGPKGPAALLSTGKVRRNDVIPGSQFRVESIDAQAVTLVAENERVVLPATTSRPGRIRTLPR